MVGDRHFSSNHPTNKLTLRGKCKTQRRNRNRKRNHQKKKIKPNTLLDQEYARLEILQEGTTLSQNLLKHSTAPIIPPTHHPHPLYNKYPRIRVTTTDPELRRLFKETGYRNNALAVNAVNANQLHCRCPHKDKFMQLLDTDVPDTKSALVWTACRHTTYAAAKRQMKAAPTPDPAVADDFLLHSQKIIEKELGDDLTHFGYSVTDWYNHLSTKKQKALQPALDYYSGKTYNIKPRDLENLQNKHYTGILKEELQPTDGKPRMVCAIPQSTKYIMGPITWQLEETFAQKLQGYCGGQNLDQMADHINTYLAQGFTKVVEGDGSAFDNTQDVSLKAVDRYIYSRIRNAVYHVPKEDFDEVAQALQKTMDIDYIDGKKKKHMLTYTILGTVFSGDCDTTLMNTTRMALYNRYVNDKAGLVFGKDYVCFAKGDDFTVMYKPYVTNEFITKAYYRYFLPANPDPTKPDTRIYGLGQVLKMLEFGDASILKFCSLRAWFTDPSETQIYLTRDPQKFLTLTKFSRKAKKKGVEYVHDYLLAQAQALETNYPRLAYFSTMAEVYKKQACYLKKKFPFITTNYKLKNQIVTILDQVINSTEDMNSIAFDEIEALYQENVHHRQQQIKIMDNYWDTMRALEKAHQKTITADQADYISQQLLAEFMKEYLKSMIPSGAHKNL